jgi:hypothetical protein
VHWPARCVQRCAIHGFANLECFGARATRKRNGSFVFARIIVFARNGSYTRIDLYKLVSLSRARRTRRLARIGSDRSYRARIGCIALVSVVIIGSYWSYRSCWLVLTRICPYRTRISSYELVLARMNSYWVALACVTLVLASHSYLFSSYELVLGRFGLRHTRASTALVLAL